MNDAAATAETMLQACFKGRIGNFDLDAQFELPMTGTTALFGASGCGKTSLLRCVAGLNRVDGRLQVGGELWQDSKRDVFKKPHQRNLGFVFQEASLFAHLSVQKNLLYGASRSTRSNHEQVIQHFDFDEIVEMLGIASLLQRATTDLSGGERQRVAVGRALLSQPRLLLMDEPLAALDRQSRQEILPYLERISTELKLPILYVSHDLPEVARLADRIVLMSDGAVVASGPLTTMLERLDLQPATGRFEASTIISARVVSQDDDYLLTTLDVNGQRLTIPAIDLVAGEQLRLRVRARDVTLATVKPENISIRNALNGTVLEIREEADTAFAETLIDIGGGRIRARITRQAVADLGLTTGCPVFALVKSISFDRRARV